MNLTSVFSLLIVRSANDFRQVIKTKTHNAVQNLANKSTRKANYTKYCENMCSRRKNLIMIIDNINNCLRSYPVFAGDFENEDCILLQPFLNVNCDSDDCCGRSNSFLMYAKVIIALLFWSNYL